MKPIIFNTEMVKAILDGRKVSTRRPVKCVPPSFVFDGIVDDEHPFLKEYLGHYHFKNEVKVKERGSGRFAKPPYQIDDILYVRETWCRLVDQGFAVDNNITKYRADGEKIFYNIEKESGTIIPKWKPSIHMPKDVARLFLKVTAVRVERLNSVSEQDSVKEGLYTSAGLYRGAIKKNGCKGGYANPINAFKSIWNSIYNNWDSNPWVWVIDFEVVKL